MKSFLPVVPLLIGMGISVGGCANDRSDHDRSYNPAPATSAEATVPAAQNEQAAATKLKEAADAEARGDLGRAMEAYVQLRSFPKQYQPNDLDQRIAALQKKMDHH